MPPEGTHDGASFFCLFSRWTHLFLLLRRLWRHFPASLACLLPHLPVSFLCSPHLLLSSLENFPHRAGEAVCDFSPISLFCLQPQSAGIACATQPVDKVGWQQSDVLSRTAHKVENHRMLRPHARDPPPRPSHTVPCPSTEGRSSTPARSRSFCAHRTPSPVRWSPNGAHLTTLATDWSLPCPLAPCGSPPF